MKKTKTIVTIFTLISLAQWSAWGASAKKRTSQKVYQVQKCDCIGNYKGIPTLRKQNPRFYANALPTFAVTLEKPVLQKFHFLDVELKFQKQGLTVGKRFKIPSQYLILSIIKIKGAQF